MPELPEVECVRQGILAECLGHTISKVWSRDTGLLLDADSLPLRQLKGERLDAVERRGKYLRWLTPKFQLLTHLGMTGVWSSHGARAKHTRVELSFVSKTLRYTDPRQFGYLCLRPRAEALPRWEQLGPDALSRQFTAQGLFHTTRDSAVEVKVWLMEQKHVAGIGNIYASEALFRAHVHPQRKVKTLSLQECQHIVQHAKAVMRLSLKHRGTTFSDYRLTNGKGGEFQGFLKVFQKTGEPCPTCAQPIQQITQGGRSTFFCAHCQK